MEDLKYHLEGRLDGFKEHLEEQLTSNNTRMEGRMDGLENKMSCVQQDLK